MLSMNDIDTLMQKIQNGEKAYVYFVAHMLETREGFLDAEHYKSVARFKVVKLEVTNIYNAYFEYLDFVKHPENYHTEIEEEWYDPITKYIHLYTVPNGESSYDKTFNANVPSIIFGRRKQVCVDGQIIKEQIDPSPVEEVYTNNLEYGNLYGDSVKEKYDAGLLDWKYMTLENTEQVDGIDYKYVTSDWYILDIKNFPRTEKALVNIDRISAYFMDLDKAWYYIDQLS